MVIAYTGQSSYSRDFPPTFITVSADDPIANVATEAVSALFDKIGPGIFITHSQSGGPGWLTAMKNRNVRAVVSFEPGGDFPSKFLKEKGLD